MGRCKKKRKCRDLGQEIIFKPRGIPALDLELTELQADEFEALCLCDYELLSQDGAGEKMGISRGTVQRLVKAARFKIADALLNSKAIIIKKNNEV